MSETCKVFITRQAENDLVEIYDYIAADNPVTADAFVLALEEKVFSLATMPERMPLIPENNLLGTCMLGQAPRGSVIKNQGLPSCFRAVHNWDGQTGCEDDK